MPFRRGEWESVLDHFPTAEMQGPETGLVVVADFLLAPGWSAARTTVTFAVPPAYPAAQPDCFWTSPDLRLASGAVPMNTAPQIPPGSAQQALWFSWHLPAWRPAVDTLMTYLRFVGMRFVDAR
jgi:hypothetical protein